MALGASCLEEVGTLLSIACEDGSAICGESVCDRCRAIRRPTAHLSQKQPLCDKVSGKHWKSALRSPEMFYFAAAKSSAERGHNGRWQAVARQEISDDVRGWRENIPASKPILSSGGMRFCLVVRKFW